MSNSLSPEQFDELCKLIHALHEKTITLDQKARLEEWVCRDEEACWVYIQYSHLCADLRWRKIQNPDPERPPKSGRTPKSQTPILGFLGDVFQAGTGFLSRSLVLTLLLTIGLPGLLLLMLLFQIQSEPVAKPPAVETPASRAVNPTVVAKITQTSECVWEKPDGALSAGASLLAGQQLRLREGLVELEFGDGSKVILKGPATFETLGIEQGFLKVGSLVAHVGKGSEGFKVTTPAATVTDLGTEFGLTVEADGMVETHVFKGLVEVATRTTPQNPAPATARLQAGEAARIRAAKAGQTPRIVTIAAVPEQFVRQLPTPSKPKVLFAHHGSTDPVTEGWRLQRLQNKKLVDVKPDPLAMTPITDGDTAAWMLNNRADKEEIRYSVTPEHGLSRQVIEEGKANGWVMRARIKVDDMGDNTRSICYFGYCDGNRVYLLFPEIRKDGGMQLILHGQSSRGTDARIPIPDSRDRFVDYEIRYNPVTNDAEVFVDSQSVATGFYKQKIDPMKDDTTGIRGIQFGLQGRLSQARFAMVEFELLAKETSAEQSRGK